MTSHDASSRREFLRRTAGLAGAAALGAALPSAVRGQSQPAGKKFDLSLAAWSVHRLFYDGKLKQIDMPALCRKEFDIGALELVNSFFPSPQYAYCKDLLKRAADHGVRILLIMCDGEGELAHADAAVRRQSVRNHRKWVDIAAMLGCHSIRVNLGGAQRGDDDAVARAAESLVELAEYARPDKLNVIVENHGGMSSDPDALVAVMKRVNDPLVGTLPDFGNFPAEVDRYRAIELMMPFAKAVSAKCHDFDAAGNETRTDYARMMKIVLDAGYRGFVGIEYEGEVDDEVTGVRKCQKLLQRFQ